MRPDSTTSFRPDIEGLRAVAVLLVLAFHAKLPAMTGGYIGVDVFFVISGFLITGILVREAERTHTISLTKFYARRAKRLLPASAIVLVATALLAWRFAPITDRATFGLDLVAAAAYFINWRLAARSVDYLAEGVGPSPALHFWSLSVEEQFYLLWPLLILVSVWSARRLRKPVRSVTVVALLCVALPSLVCSIVFTRESPSEAFFVTTTRLWELSVGAFLALSLGRLQELPKRWSGLLAWAGAGMIAISAVAFDATTAWPSWRALLPVLGTAAIIGAGVSDQNGAGTPGPNGVVARALSARVMVFIGGLSYSIYLWHWPLIVAARDWLELEGVAWGVALVAVSIVPAWLSYRFVERPIRFARRLAESSRRALSLGVALTALNVLCGLLLARSLPADDASASTGPVAIEVRGHVLIVKPRGAGALALGSDPTHSSAGVPQKRYASVTPSPTHATKDLPLGQECQVRETSSDPIWCDGGDPNGKIRIAIVGDSKARQYNDAFDAIAKARGWHLTSATMSGCPFSAAERLLDGKPYENCTAHNWAVLRKLTAQPPDAVIVSQRTPKGYLPGENPKPTRAGMIDGLVQQWTRLGALGARVIVLLDNPSPYKVKGVYRCLAQHPDAADRCAFDRRDGIKASAAGVLRAAAQRLPGTRVIDLTDEICPASRCAPVIGGVLVYRQGSHLTRSYTLTLAPVLGEHLAKALEGIDSETPVH